MTSVYTCDRNGSPTIYTNSLTLDGATMRLGGGAVGGAMTNHAMVRAQGTVVGVGASPAQVYSTGKLEIGGSIGTLTMTNCDVVQSSSGIASFEFDASGCDQIAINGGTATIGGTCQFATVAFTPVQGMGQDWDFIRADSVTYTASDNMTNLMGSYGLVLGGDYSYGVVDEGAVQALRLRIFGPKGTLILIW